MSSIDREMKMLALTILIITNDDDSNDDNNLISFLKFLIYF